MSDMKKPEPIPCACGTRHDIAIGESVVCQTKGCGTTIRRHRVGDVGSCIEIVPKR